MKTKTTKKKTLSLEEQLAERLVNNELKILVNDNRMGILIYSFAETNKPLKPVQVVDFTQMVPGASTRMPTKKTPEGFLIVQEDDDGDPLILACALCGMIGSAKRIREHKCIAKTIEEQVIEKKKTTVRRKRGRPRKEKKT